jgi:hypothetical protein
MGGRQIDTTIKKLVRGGEGRGEEEDSGGSSQEGGWGGRQSCPCRAPRRSFDRSSLSANALETTTATMTTTMKTKTSGEGAPSSYPTQTAAGKLAQGRGGGTRSVHQVLGLDPSAKMIRNSMQRRRATWFGPRDISNTTGDGHSTGVKGEGNGFGGWWKILQGRCAFTVPI